MTFKACIWSVKLKGYLLCTIVALKGQEYEKFSLLTLSNTSFPTHDLWIVFYPTVPQLQATEIMWKFCITLKIRSVLSLMLVCHEFNWRIDRPVFGKNSPEISVSLNWRKGNIYSDRLSHFQSVWSAHISHSLIHYSTNLKSCAGGGNSCFVSC